MPHSRLEENRAELHADPGRWPDVAKIPRARARGLAARLVFGYIARQLPLRVKVGRRYLGGGAENSPLMVVTRPSSFFRRLGQTGLIGFGESYLAGDWHAADLVAVLSIFASRMGNYLPAWADGLRRYVMPGQPSDRANTIRGARDNIQKHYDWPIELFTAFLDETMTYSSGLFTNLAEEASGGHQADEAAELAASAQILMTAQCRKIDRLLDLTNVHAETRLLEIGCGWGGLAIRAARRGAHVRSVTISPGQYEYARRRVTEENLDSRVDIRLEDYREISGTYDAIVSVEMIEAVGGEFWETYFETIDRLLAPGGLAGIQTITMPHDRMLASRNSYTWIQKYIFPGGLLPSLPALTDIISRRTRLQVSDDLSFGDSYARTIALWTRRFAVSEESLRQAGFDEIFLRMWRFYLAYVEAGFRTGYLDVHQLLLAEK